MKFRDFYTNYEEYKKPQKKSEEDLFEEVTGISVPSLNSFVAWLTLHNHIKPYVKSNGKPVPVTKLAENKKILYLVRKLPKIKELANEFASKFSKAEYLRD